MGWSTAGLCWCPMQVLTQQQHRYRVPSPSLRPAEPPAPELEEVNGALGPHTWMDSSAQAKHDQRREKWAAALHNAKLRSLRCGKQARCPALQPLFHLQQR